MLRFHFLLLVTVLCTIKQIECKIQDILPGYYDNESVKRFGDEWSKYQRAFENAIGTGLQQEFGRSSVNIFEERRPVSHLLAEGFSLSDGVVDVYFFDMSLRELPLLVRPELKMSLSDNYQSIFARVGRMFIDATYYVARNKSTEVYAHPKDQKDMSPFSLQQVERFGRVAITVEDCLLRGYSVVSLSGDSVNLGHTTASVYDCKFTVELSTPYSGAPPVIAPYFPKGPKEKLELVLTTPILSELQSKLQGALYSYVNTSVLFGPQGSEFRKKQQNLFKNYAQFIRNYVFKVNQNTLKANRGVVQLPNYSIRLDSRWDSQYHPRLTCTVGLKDLKLYGLETAYVGRSGGPYKNNSRDTAADAIIFSSFQIRGKVTHDDGAGAKVYDFTAELRDIAVDIEIKITGSKTEILQMKMTGWRSLAFGIIPWHTPFYYRISYKSLVYGYILNELPTRVIKHLTSILGNIANDESNKFDGGSGGDRDSGSGGDGGGGSNAGGGSDKTDLYGENDGKRPGGKKEFFTDDNLDKDFFTDDNLKKDFFTDDNIKKDFFTDDNIKKDFFTDDNIKKDFFTDDNIKKDFFTDDNIKKDFFTDDNIKKDFFTDDNIKKDFFTDDNIKEDFLTDDNIKEDFFTDGEIKVTDDNGGVTGETDNSRDLTGETNNNGGVTGETDNNRDLTGETDSNGGVTGETDNNRDLSGETDNNGGVTGETDNNRDLSGETDNNGGVTGETDNKRDLTGETDNNGGVTGETDKNTDLNGETDNNGGVLGATGNNGGLTGREYKTDDIGELTDREFKTKNNGGLTGREYKTDGDVVLTGVKVIKTDDIGGLTGREYKSDDIGGLTGREYKTDDIGGLTGREYKTDDIGGLTGREYKNKKNGGLTGREYKTDDIGGLTGREYKTDDIGGLTGRENKNKKNGGLTGREYKTDDIGGLTGRENKNKKNGGLTGREYKTDHIGGLTGREYKTDHIGGLTGREYKTDDYAEGLGDGRVGSMDHSAKGFGDDNGKPFLDENFFSDFESRRLAAKINHNDTANIQISKQKEDDSKKDHSNGHKRSRIGSGKATDQENIRQNVKNNSRTVKKPALPPNVHNMPRLNNPRMSENEIR